MPAVIDMRDLGRVNDQTFDNTAALLAGLARRDANEPLELFFAPGDWYFSGPVPVNSPATLPIFDNVSISGQFTGPSVQHQEEGLGNAIKDRTRFVIALISEDNIWWYQIRTYRFGPLAFRDITFLLPNLGSLFAFGDPANTETLKTTLRGLYFERCYMTRSPFQYGTNNVGDGRAWLHAAGGSPDKGDVINQSVQSFGLRLQRCYDTRLDLYIRGFRYGVINIQGDRVSGSLRGYIVGKLLDEYAGPAVNETAPVGGHWQSIYAEAVAFAGAVVNGQVNQLRAEWGYGGIFTPDTGPRAMPPEVTWAILVPPDVPVANRIEFTFPPNWGYNCIDYFEPRMPYRFTPTTAGEPYRWLYVTKVEANHLTFADHLSKSYVKNELNGNGAGILRPFGTGVILDGDRASVIDPSIGCNEERSNSPGIFVRPGSKPVKVGGNAESIGKNPTNKSNLPVIIASSAGAQFTLQGGVDFMGSADVPNHPLVNAGGIGPSFDANTREPIFDPHTRTQLFRPGRGVRASQGASRDLIFHWWGDPEEYTAFIVLGAVDDSSPSATAFRLSAPYSPGSEQYYAGRSLIFTNGALSGRVANIIAYGPEAPGPNGQLTVYGLPAAPATGDALKVIGVPTACYRPGDMGNVGWELRPLRQSGVETSYRIRVYLPAGTSTLEVYGAVLGTPNSHVLAIGWQTIVSRLTKSQMADDQDGSFIRLRQVGDPLYVAWAEINQNPPTYSGVYTPVISGAVNVSVTVNDCQYLRVGNTVTVSGMFTIDPVTAEIPTVFDMSLPFASAFTGATNGGGTAHTSGLPGYGIPVLTNSVGGTMRFNIYPTSIASMLMPFHFTYRII